MERKTVTIKIKAPKAWAGKDIVRIVREADWKKLMKLVRGVESFLYTNGTDEDLVRLLDALRGKR